MRRFDLVRRRSWRKSNRSFAMDLTLEYVLDWAFFPASFLEKWESEIARTEGSDGGVLIDIHAEYTPGCPGRYDGHPDNMYPAEDPEVEVCATSITVRRDSAFLDRELDQQFLDICHQFALDWIEINAKVIEERLFEHGASIHKNEMSEILAEIEMDIENNRRGCSDGDMLADYAAATHEAQRTSGGDI